MKAKEIMSKDVVVINTETTIEEIAHILVDKNISGLPVVDAENKVVGIVTERDILYKDIEPRFPPVVELLGGLVFLGGKHYNDELKKLVATKAKDIMKKHVITVSEDTDVTKVAEIMIEKGINRIPVVSGGKLAGIISRSDLVKFIAESM